MERGIPGRGKGVMGLRSGVAIDLGTVNTLVYVTGRGIVIDEPSAIGIDPVTGTVVAVGQAADSLTMASSPT
jgi:rod shape-determining protein MreB and related proteins